jgi:N-acetylgalactosamine-N,N'-diacetylbacillosaminyl-diphospho-undecaprenol 4-alpha-N-acetylgalactosaminyltransferase
LKSKPNLSILNISLTSGGAEKVISLLLKELVNDYNVTLVLLYNDIHFAIPKSVETVFFHKEAPNRFFLFKFFDAVSFCFKYNRLLRKQKIEYAVSFLAFPNLLNGLAAILNPKIRTYVSERGFPSDNTTSKLSLYISKIFYPLLYNRCYKLFSNSVYINQDLAKNFGVKIPMDVIYNPIEIPLNIRRPESFLNANKPLKLINAGTLNTRKNQMMILKALNKLDSDKFILSVLGDGHLKEELLQKVAYFKLNDRAKFYGKVKNVGEYLIQHDCFILSSFTEGFPNALLEAMSYGLPCISTNCLSGPLELLNNGIEVNIEQGEYMLAKYGILINNDDDYALVKALNYLQKNADIRSYYSKMSTVRARDYELQSIYGQFKNFIHS